jgi:xanthine dehydrogenase accessory factor
MNSIYQALAALEESNELAALCTIVRSQGATPRHTSSKMIVYPDGSILGSVGGGELENRVRAEALQAMQEDCPRLLKYQMADTQRGDVGNCGGEVEVFVEPIQPKPVLLVIGSGHVGKAVVHLGRWLGFYVVVSDDRQKLCNAKATPEAHEYHVAPMKDLPSLYRITPWTYIVLTTRGVDVDVPGLPAILTSPAAYIGVIGSRRRWITTRKQLLQAGITEELLNRVHSPIGLELNAETPEEIAVSILAEIIMLRYRGDGKMMSLYQSQPETKSDVVRP